MNVKSVEIFICPYCKSDKLRLVPFSWIEEEMHLSDGVLCCDACEKWYPVIEEVPLLLMEEDLFADLKEEFIRKWEGRFDFKLSGSRLKAPASKWGQVEHYSEDSQVYDDLVPNSIFWQASDWNTIGRWIKEMLPTSKVLDIGCGTGRCTIPMAEAGMNTIGMDISYEMVKKAVEKARKIDSDKRPEYIVADAENIPFSRAVFDIVVGFGILHHVETPSKVVKNVSDVLVDGGIFYALENNKSKLRFIFDFLMRISKLWNEEAGSNPLLDKDEVKEWARASKMEAQVKTSTFLPPHLFNIMNVDLAKKTLSFTDKVFTNIPWLKDNGGQLIIECRKA